jgi:hypothetical protein
VVAAVAVAVVIAIWLLATGQVGGSWSSAPAGIPVGAGRPRDGA